MPARIAVVAEFADRGGETVEDVLIQLMR